MQGSCGRGANTDTMMGRGVRGGRRSTGCEGPYRRPLCAIVCVFVIRAEKALQQRPGGEGRNAGPCAPSHDSLHRTLRISSARSGYLLTNSRSKVRLAERMRPGPLNRVCHTLRINACITSRASPGLQTLSQSPLSPTCDWPVFRDKLAFEVARKNHERRDIGSAGGQRGLWPMPGWPVTLIGRSP